MVESLYKSTDNVIELPGLENWLEDFGGDLLSGSKYRLVAKPIVEPLPQDQIWTLSNQGKSAQLEVCANRYIAQGRENKRVLTLQALSVNHIGLSDTHADRLWDEGNDDLAVNVENGDSEEVVIALSNCSYYEHLAWVLRDVDGMENPNGLLVSILPITVDDKIVLTRRSSVSAGAGMLGVVGGTYDYHSNQTTPTPEDVARDELFEELGVSPKEYKLHLITLMEDKLKRPVLFYRSRLDLTADEVLHRWSNSQTTHSEHSELFFIRNSSEEILDFAQKHSPDEFHEPADLIFQYAMIKQLNSETNENIMAGSTAI